METREKLQGLLKTINKGLIGREEAIKIALLTLLTGENLILIGPPGTAKSEIARRLCTVINEGEYFEYLLTKFTTPEELFGPLSIQELEKDNFHRKTTGYLPSSHVGFLDEIFKANSAILNSLLSLLNERVFHNGTDREETQILSILGASNELPDREEEELHALYDRFLTRLVVDYVENDKFVELLLSDDEFIPASTEFQISLSELKDFQSKCKTVTIPQNIANGLLRKIREEIQIKFSDNTWEQPSDRRFKKALKILKASAYTNGREEVNVLDVSLLVHCFWSEEKNREQIQKLILEHLPAITGNDAAKIKDIYEQWWEEFHKLFGEFQKQDKEGKPLFLDGDGKETTKKISKRHTQDENGEYRYESQHSYSSMTHKKSEKEHPENHNYQAILEEYECKPMVCYSYDLYRKGNNTVKQELLSPLESIYRQVNDEQNEIKSIYEEAQAVKDNIEKEFDIHLWIDKKSLEIWKKQSIKDFKEVEKLKEKWEILYAQIEEAQDLALEDKKSYEEKIKKGRKI